MTIPNFISFNGKIISDEPIDVGNGFYVLKILAGQTEEFPMLLIKAPLEEIKKGLRKDDLIIGVGYLKKIQDEYFVQVKEINRIPNKEEFESLKDE